MEKLLGLEILIILINVLENMVQQAVQNIISNLSHFRSRNSLANHKSIFRSGRISSVYIVNKWVVVTLLSKLVNFECVGMLECVGVLDWKSVRLEEFRIVRV